MSGYNQRSSGSAIAEMYWDFMDVNANLTRAEWVARQIGNGWHAGINFAVMVILTGLAIILAWHFDFHSTYAAMETLISHIVIGLPDWVGLNDTSEKGAATAALIVAIISAVVTIAPTLMEIFTSNLARANILVIKVFVLGASAFDVITDIPTTKAWIATWQPSFDALPGPIAWIVYWVAFFIWLAMATVGFQLTVAIFFYMTIIYFRKMTVGMPISYGPIPNVGQQPKPDQQPKKKVAQPQVVKVQPATAVAEADAD